MSCNLVDLPKREHILTDYAPGFVRIGVVTKIFEASIKAEINRRWPEDPFAAGK